MRIALFSSGFNSSELRLQPWLTLNNIGLRLKSAGHDVWLVTDSYSKDPLPLPVQRFRTLRGTNSAEITAWIKYFKPERTVVSVSPFSLATAGWYSALDPNNSLAFLPYALYTCGELLNARRYLSAFEFFGYGRNLLMPNSLWRQRLAQRFRGVVCQSQRTAKRLSGNVNYLVIPPGIDLSQWQMIESRSLTDEEQRIFLYLGSPKAIRGFDVLLEAMKRLPDNIFLRVLARGLEESELTKLKSHFSKIGLASRITLQGGWLTPADLRFEIQHAAAVVLPFVLVPSEIPVSVMEAIACGTSVIVSDIDGLPEAAGSAAIIVPAGNSMVLAEEMFALTANEQRRHLLHEACFTRRQQYIDWDEVTKRWATALDVQL